MSSYAGQLQLYVCQLTDFCLCGLSCKCRRHFELKIKLGRSANGNLRALRVGVYRSVAAIHMPAFGRLFLQVIMQMPKAFPAQDQVRAIRYSNLRALPVGVYRPVTAIHMPCFWMFTFAGNHANAEGISISRQI